jgi:hypothetical protein
VNSLRFSRPVILTRHALQRMVERNISEADVLEIIDHGDTRCKDASHLWAFKAFPERQDNLLCAVLVLEHAVVVKTIMHHFELKDTP